MKLPGLMRAALLAVLGMFMTGEALGMDGPTDSAYWHGVWAVSEYQDAETTGATGLARIAEEGTSGVIRLNHSLGRDETSVTHALGSGTIAEDGQPVALFATEDGATTFVMRAKSRNTASGTWQRADANGAVTTATEELLRTGGTRPARRPGR